MTGFKRANGRMPAAAHFPAFAMQYPYEMMHSALIAF